MTIEIPIKDDSIKTIKVLNALVEISNFLDKSNLDNQIYFPSFSFLELSYLIQDISKKDMKHYSNLENLDETLNLENISKENKPLYWSSVKDRMVSKAEGGLVFRVENAWDGYKKFSVEEIIPSNRKIFDPVTSVKRLLAQRSVKDDYHLNLLNQYAKFVRNGTLIKGLGSLATNLTENVYLGKSVDEVKEKVVKNRINFIFSQIESYFKETQQAGILEAEGRMVELNPQIDIYREFSKDSIEEFRKYKSDVIESASLLNCDLDDLVRGGNLKLLQHEADLYSHIMKNPEMTPEVKKGCFSHVSNIKTKINGYKNSQDYL